MKIYEKLPEESVLSKENIHYDYQDSMVITLNRRSIESWEPVAAFFQCAPSWIVLLFKLRNKIASIFGLKTDLADLSQLNPPYETGKAFGVFKLHSISENEAILGEQDKHLDFKVSFLIREAESTELALSTIVKINNRLGKVYMFFVKPVHKIIVPIMLKRMAQSIEKKALPQYALEISSTPS